jgi:hypothetical protein
MQTTMPPQEPHCTLQYITFAALQSAQHNRERRPRHDHTHLQEAAKLQQLLQLAASPQALLLLLPLQHRSLSTRHYAACCLRNPQMGGFAGICVEAKQHDLPAAAAAPAPTPHVLHHAAPSCAAALLTQRCKLAGLAFAPALHMPRQCVLPHML